MSDEKQETVADIVAFIGKCLDLIDTELTRMSNKEHAMSADALLCPVLNAKAALDRIGAAWKRERAEVEADALSVGGIVEAARTAGKSSAFGNAAVMREALVTAKKAICHHAAHVCQSLSWENSDIQSNCADVLCAHRELCEAKTAIQKALSAPARNCDLYDDAEIAWRAWLDDKDNWYEFGGSKLELHEWLFASAKMKGEGDGSK